jgi:hypothetical protein
MKLMSVKCERGDLRQWKRYQQQLSMAGRKKVGLEDIGELLER